MDQRIEHARLGLLARNRLGSSGFGERAYAVEIAAGDRQFRSGVGQRKSRAAGRAAIAHQQHGSFRQPQPPLQRNRDSVGIGVGAAPLSRFSPHRVDRADAPRQRIDQVEIAQDLLLVRDGHAESGQRQLLGQHQKILELRRLHQKRQIHRIQTARLKRAVVHGR